MKSGHMVKSLVETIGQEENLECSSAQKILSDFKRNAILLSEEPGRSVSEVADNLGMAIFSRASK